MPKSIFITKNGGPEVLQFKESPHVELGPHDVRIEVRASGINFADLMMRMGLYPEAPKTPFIPGYEVAGMVTEIGVNVSRVKKGDRVFAGCKFGGYTTELVVTEANVYGTPGKLSDAEAAGIPVNFMTAWIALHEMGRVRKGDRVLVQSAAGGVGTAAIQIAARAGAHVVGTIGSPQKAQTVKDLGAKEVILNSEWENGSDSDLGDYDIILDPIGGASLKRSFRRLGTAGRIVCYGMSTAVGKKKSLPRLASMLLNTPLYTPFQLMMANSGIYGLNLLKYFEPKNAPKLLKTMDELLKGFEREEYRVIVGKKFPLEKAGDAQEYLQSRANIGKAILEC